jgi:DNA-binding YbaB/EbfC family protein
MKNMQQMMQQAQKMQEQMQKQLEETEVEASAGGEMVSVKMNGNKQLLSIEIDPEVLSGGDREMLQDLIVAAVNEATRRVDEEMAGQLGNLASGLKIPGL